MKGPYTSLWLLLTVGFALFFAVSAFGGFSIGSVEIETSGMYAALTKPVESDEALAEAMATEPAPPAPAEPKFVVDTLPQRILFIGDSMLEGLSPRLAAYAKENGHTLYSVIWYGSTTKAWGNCRKLAEYIKTYKPTFIFISLGGNEMFVRDIKTKHLTPLRNMIQQIGEIPYVWIGPPNWKPDTGINELLAGNIPAERLFVSEKLQLARSSDKIHPTRAAAYSWFDMVAKWMGENHDYRIKLEKPSVTTAKPAKVLLVAPPK